MNKRNGLAGRPSSRRPAGMASAFSSAQLAIVKRAKNERLQEFPIWASRTIWCRMGCFAHHYPSRRRGGACQKQPSRSTQRRDVLDVLRCMVACAFKTCIAPHLIPSSREGRACMGSCDGGGSSGWLVGWMDGGWMDEPVQCLSDTSPAAARTSFCLSPWRGEGKSKVRLLHITSPLL